MAFGMHADGDHQIIGLHEEFIFHLARADEDAFPALMWLWDAYYDSPAISPQQASALMHELLELWARHGVRAIRHSAGCACACCGFSAARCAPTRRFARAAIEPVHSLLIQARRCAHHTAYRLAQP